MQITTVTFDYPFDILYNIFISIFLGLGIIVLESIFPILPLALFIATNVLVFGKIFGFVLCEHIRSIDYEI